MQSSVETLCNNIATHSQHWSDLWYLIGNFSVISLSPVLCYVFFCLYLQGAVDCSRSTSSRTAHPHPSLPKTAWGYRPVNMLLYGRFMFWTPSYPRGDWVLVFGRSCVRNQGVFIRLSWWLSGCGQVAIVTVWRPGSRLGSDVVLFSVVNIDMEDSFRPLSFALHQSASIVLFMKYAINYVNIHVLWRNILTFNNTWWNIIHSLNYIVCDMTAKKNDRNL